MLWHAQFPRASKNALSQCTARPPHHHKTNKISTLHLPFPFLRRPLHSTQSGRTTTASIAFCRCTAEVKPNGANAERTGRTNDRNKMILSTFVCTYDVSYMIRLFIYRCYFHVWFISFADRWAAGMNDRLCVSLAAASRFDLIGILLYSRIEADNGNDEGKM